MKETINKNGLSIYEFEDSQEEMSDAFSNAISQVDAATYVIDRMIASVGYSVLEDLGFDSFTSTDSDGLNIDSSNNLLKTVINSFKETVFENEQNRHNAWEIVHQCGLPRDNNGWSYNSTTRQFFKTANRSTKL